MNDYSERIWKEVLMACYKELLQYLHDKDVRTLRLHGPPTYEAGVH
jgi:hypothetical protein